MKQVGCLHRLYVDYTKNNKPVILEKIIRIDNNEIYANIFKILNTEETLYESRKGKPLAIARLEDQLAYLIELGWELITSHDHFLDIADRRDRVYILKEP